MEMNCHEGLLGYGKDFFTFTVSKSLGTIKWFGLEECHELIWGCKGSAWPLHLQWFRAEQRKKQEMP